MSKVKLTLLCIAGLVGVLGYQVGKNAWATSAVDTENVTQLGNNLVHDPGRGIVDNVGPSEFPVDAR